MKYSTSTAAFTLIFLFIIAIIPLQQTIAQEIRTFSGHSGDVESVAFSPDGKYGLSGSWDNTLKLWAISTKTLVEDIVQQRIESWQQKGKYESTADYRERVTEQKREQMPQIFGFESQKVLVKHN